MLIDVRSEEEYKEGHREGAVNIPLDKIMAGDMGALATLPKDTEIQCYCFSGGRSEVMKNILNKNGFLNVTNLGGM